MVEIIAHRGASKDHCENTRAAFQAALEQGADGIELDVHCTRDGHVVVHHDFDVRDPSTGTSTPIARMTLTQLRELTLSNGETIPSLDDVLEITGDRAVTYIEVKGLRMEREVVDCLARHPRARVAVHSFDHRIPIAIRRLRPETSIGLLSASYPMDLAAFIGAHRPDALWQLSTLIDEELVQSARNIGARTIAWTANDPVHALALVRAGVSALCTDTPGKLRHALQRELN